MTIHVRQRLGRGVALLALMMSLVVLVPDEAAARVRLKDICRVSGEREVKLVGIGLVTGLAGTGNGGKNRPALRALAAKLELMHAPALEFNELKDAKNFDLVLIEATIPKNGARRGQKIDCYVTSFVSAKSLRGGRLMPTPLESAQVDDDITRGIASGGLVIEGSGSNVVGKIPGGVTLSEDFIHSFVDVYRGGVITLLLNPSHAGFQTSGEIAQAINNEFNFEVGSNVSRAVGAGVIEVSLPKQYRNSPVEFVASVLEVGIDNPNSQARVTVNNKTNVIIIDGDVEISPVVVSHKNLVIDVGDGDQRLGTFVPLDSRAVGQATKQLTDLVTALKSLKVPPEDMIDIVRELNRSGKLHAEYNEQ